MLRNFLLLYLLCMTDVFSPALKQFVTHIGGVTALWSWIKGKNLVQGEHCRRRRLANVVSHILILDDRKKKFRGQLERRKVGRQNGSTDGLLKWRKTTIKSMTKYIRFSNNKWKQKTFIKSESNIFEMIAKRKTKKVSYLTIVENS